MGLGFIFVIMPSSGQEMQDQRYGPPVEILL